MIPYKKHTFYALSFFFLAAFMGLLLRASFVFNVNMEYRYVVHAHSHVALMGWIHFALMTLITYYFLNQHIPIKKYNRIFLVTMLSVVGMLISFPIQGYAVFSIIFSSLFLISTYFFTYLVFKYTPKEEKKKASFKVLRWALIYMVVSSFGPWSVGGIMATLGPSSHWYRTSIYLYLHFQYNAWIILGIIAVIFKILEKNNFNIDKRLFKLFLNSFNIGAILTLFISVLYIKPPFIYFILSIIGSLSQLIAIYFLLKIFLQNKAWFTSSISKLNQRLFFWAFVLFAVKSIMQLVGSFPAMAEIISQNNFLAIGFLHLVFLGVLTLPIFALLEKTKLIRVNNISIQSFAVGLAATEFIIFYKPAVKILNFPPSPNYDVFLFVASLFLVVGITIILVRMVRIRIV